MKPLFKTVPRIFFRALLVLAAILVSTTTVFILLQFLDLRVLLADYNAKQDLRNEELQGRMQHISQRIDALAEAVDRGSRANTNGNDKALERSLLKEMARLLKRSEAGKTASMAPAGVEGAPPRKADQDLKLMSAMRDGRERFEAGKYAEAAGLLSPVVERQPDNTEARLYYSASVFRANPSETRNFPSIEQNLRIVLRDRREDALALETMGSLCMERQNWPEALEWFSQAIPRRHGDVELLRKAGSCALSAGSYRQAQTCFDEACGRKPADADLWYSAGCAYAEAGKNEEAVKRFLKCLEIKPGHAAAGLKTGLAYRDLHEYRKAMTYLSASLSARPRFESLDAMGDCLYGTGDLNAAEENWKQALALSGSGKNGKAAAVCIKLARLAWENGEPEKCRSYAQEGSGSDPVLQAYLGMSYMSLGENEKGSEILKGLIKAHPNTEASTLAEHALRPRKE